MTAQGRASLTDPSPGLALTIVAPVFNESACLEGFLAELSSQLDRLGRYYEIILVDDGSTDGTREFLGRLRPRFPALRPFALDGHHGQSAAVWTGISLAQGPVIILLDADLQNDPADLAVLWDALPGHDAALGWRTKRQDVWSKRQISRWANRIRNRVLGQSIRDTGCSVRIFPREMALRLPMFRGCHRFFGPLLLREGCSVVQVPVNHRPRPHGTSHYNIWNRSVRVVVDLFGVAWLMRREVRYEVASVVDGSGAAESSTSTSTSMTTPVPGPHRIPRGVGEGQEA
jgi:glycosyltransferase involved in cell wall biosynthesis